MNTISSLYNFMYQLCSITTFKRIEKIQNLTKPDQPGISSSIRLEVMCIQTFCVLFLFPTVTNISEVITYLNGNLVIREHCSSNSIESGE